MKWVLKKFDELTPFELYAILRLRNEVFVLEQHCVYQDADGKDTAAWHLMGWDGEVLCAYTRILPPGVSFEQPSIGRVVTLPAIRRSGTGKILMEKSIEACRKLYGHTPVRIGAQLYLKKFYAAFGFVQTSDIYLEDGIEHIEMTLS